MHLRFLVILAVTGLLSGPAFAQSVVEGNWACRANIDGEKAGLLTIFAGSYGYASVTFGSTASGTGTAQIYSDGVTFLDGNLLYNAGIEVALLGMDLDGHEVLSLNTPEKPILTCIRR